MSIGSIIDFSHVWCNVYAIKIYEQIQLREWSGGERERP